jgi:hypothetical protein
MIRSPPLSPIIEMNRAMRVRRWRAENCRLARTAMVNVKYLVSKRRPRF